MKLLSSAFITITIMILAILLLLLSLQYVSIYNDCVCPTTISETAPLDLGDNEKPEAPKEGKGGGDAELHRRIFNRLYTKPL